MHQIAFFEQLARHVLRVHLHRRLGDVAEQAAQRAGAAHAVPLVAQPPGGQRERKARFTRLGYGLIDGVDKLRPAIGGGENAVFVEADFAGGFALGQRPLLGRGVQHGVAHAGDVQIAATGGFAVFVPDGFGRGVVEEALRFPEPLFQPLRKIHGDFPVMARFPRRGDGGAHAADAAFAVGDGAGFFAPGGGGQQQIRKGASRGGGEGFLHDDQLGALQCPAHGHLVGHGLGRIGAGNPQRLDFAIGGGLEHFDGGFAGLFRHRRHAPERGDFGAVRGVGQVTVAAQ